MTARAWREGARATQSTEYSYSILILMTMVVFAGRPRRRPSRRPSPLLPFDCIDAQGPYVCLQDCETHVVPSHHARLIGPAAQGVAKSMDLRGVHNLDFATDRYLSRCTSTGIATDAFALAVKAPHPQARKPSLLLRELCGRSPQSFLQIASNAFWLLHYRNRRNLGSRNRSRVGNRRPSLRPCVVVLGPRNGRDSHLPGLGSSILTHISPSSVILL